MQGQQEDLSRLSRIQSTDKPKHQENTNMDGKLQETMQMLYNLKYKMAILNGKMLKIWKLNKSENTKYSKIMGKPFMTKKKFEMLPRDIKRSEYILFLMSNTVENSRQDLWQMDILPRNPWKLSIQKLSL